MGKGYLKIELFTGEHSLPVGGMEVYIRDHNGKVLYRLRTDENGLTEPVELEAPDIRDHRTPDGQAEYFSDYDVEVPAAKRYMKVVVHNTQVFDKITSILPIQMKPAIIGASPEENTTDIYVPHDHGVDMHHDHMEQMDVEKMDTDVTRGIATSDIAIPQYITVHLGSPNATARNVRVPFKDYIKNVASSEIFPWWEESALYANIYAQITFTLNRIFTVWYRSRGKDFDITNNTAFDQFFVEGREIFDSVSRVVDRIFNMFIRRLGRKEPFFSIYYSGTTATCCGMSQWGSQDLALRGYTPIQILRYYYPSDVDIYESNTFTEQIGTFPGYSLKEGSTGEPVRTMQNYLNRISGNYYMSPAGRPDGVFGTGTKNSTTEFQRIFNLIADGIIGKSTWYEITKINVGVRQLAELTSEGQRIGIGQTPPTVTISSGSRGEYVVELQFLLNFISQFFPAVPYVIQNGVFQDPTKRAVTEFQAAFGLTPDGTVGPATWKKLYDVYHSIEDAVEIPPASPDIPAFPGVALRIGSRGDDVRIMQQRLNGIAKYYPAIPTLTADGVFGPLTETAVKAFQRQFGLTQDGVIGQITWYSIIDVYNSLQESGAPPTPETPQFPGTALRVGSRGEDVRIMQSYLTAISKVFPVIPALTADGIFGSGTQNAVMAFQRFFGLTADGVIGRITWDKIVSVYNSLPDVASPAFPGTALRVGSRGNNVIIMQKYLSALAARYPSIPTLTADGVFGAATQAAVIAFQKQFGLTADGVIGSGTWNQIVSRFNLMNSSISTAKINIQAVQSPKNDWEPLAAMMLLMRMRMR